MVPRDICLALIGFVSLFVVGVNTQCADSKGCFCFSGYVTCSGLKNFPSRFPHNTTMITMSNMSIKEIPGNIFNTLPYLTNIEIYSSNITRISSAAFAGLNNLDLISLNELRIGTIEKGAFYNLSNIGSFTVYMSTIETIESYAFNEVFAFDGMTFFMLDVNTIEPFAFSQMDDIFKFSFYSNNVTTMKPYAFLQVNNIYSFSMYLNSFGTLGCNTIVPIIEDAFEISFFSNRVACTCQLAWVINNAKIRDQLFLNWCEVPDSIENIYWNFLSRDKLRCNVDSNEGCPSLSILNARDKSKLSESIPPLTQSTLADTAMPTTSTTTKVKSFSIDTDNSPKETLTTETSSSATTTAPTTETYTTESAITMPVTVNYKLHTSVKETNLKTNGKKMTDSVKVTKIFTDEYTKHTDHSTASVSEITNQPAYSMHIPAERASFTNDASGSIRLMLCYWLFCVSIGLSVLLHMFP